MLKYKSPKTVDESACKCIEICEKISDFMDCRFFSLLFLHSELLTLHHTRMMLLDSISPYISRYQVGDYCQNGSADSHSFLPSICDRGVIRVRLRFVLEVPDDVQACLDQV